MVRLVFRPYTQISRTICTSVSLCTSIRVSPDFMLFKHSSPSFGSYQISSFSYLSQKIMDGCSCPLRLTTYTYFRYAHGFSTRKLWYVIDSLVRVSRRVYRSRFDKIAKAPHAQPSPTAKLKSSQLFAQPARHLIFCWQRTFLCFQVRPCESFPFCVRQSCPTLANSHSFLLNGFKSFNPLFKVLFIFPSQYLFAIGFPSIFSLGGSLSPDLSSNPKLLDSASTSSGFTCAKYGGFTLFAGLFQKALCARSTCRMYSPAYNSPREARRFTAWAPPCSFATTKGISVDFFSCAYWYA